MHPSMSTQMLQREIEMVRANRYEVSDDMQGSASVPRVHRQNGGSKGQHLSQQEQFLRSASARLSKKEEDPNRIDGERKREESMKRLLEWKQRMLQSPLTRKGPQLSVAPPNGQQTNSLHLPPKSPLTVQGNFYQQQQPEQQKSNHTLQRSRSDTHATSAYNGESSEDEGEFLYLAEEGRTKENSVMTLILQKFYLTSTLNSQWSWKGSSFGAWINYVTLGSLNSVFHISRSWDDSFLLDYGEELFIFCVISYSLPTS